MKILKFFGFVFLILLASFAFSMSPREAEELSRFLYSTCHGGKPEDLNKLYLRYECKEIEGKDNFFIFGKLSLENISFEKQAEYDSSGIPVSMTHGVFYEGKLKIFKLKNEKKFRSPTIAMFKKMNISNIIDLYQENPAYKKMSKDSSEEYYRAMLLPENYYALLDKNIRSIKEFGGCSKYSVEDFEIIKCWKSRKGSTETEELVGGIFYKGKIVFKTMRDHDNLIRPSYSFRYNGEKLYLFYTHAESKNPILLFEDLNKKTFGYVEVKELCPFDGYNCI